jgi:hypothetical protein
LIFVAWQIGPAKEEYQQLFGHKLFFRCPGLAFASYSLYPPLPMAVRIGVAATIRREFRQARKGATVAASIGCRRSAGAGCHPTIRVCT